MKTIKAPITFDEPSHTYTHNNTGEKFTSVTTLLGKYKKPFDADTAATRVAKREGVSKEMVLEMWDKEKNRACDRGTEIHKLLEDYITYGEQADHWSWLYKSYDKSSNWNIDKFSKVLCEQLVWNEEFKVSGLADLIYEHKDNTFTIGDFKTNKRYRFSSDYGEYMLPPLDHLPVCEHSTYGLQLSLYAYLYEQITGKKCRKLVIYYLEKDRFVAHHPSYMKAEVKELLKHFFCNG
ncbi:PD-(D/E)XK nuclease family protein [bacterium]|nr:PD-(D/E)XK nuclease family protein [bacterium]